MVQGERTGVPLFYHSDIAGYDFGANHPFRGERFESFLEELGNRFPDIYSKLEIKKPERAGDDLILLVHTQSYLERVISLEKRRGFLSLDTQVLPGSVDAARLIVGATVAAARAAVEGGVALGFGGFHHAGPDYGEGFCIFNDVAIAARALMRDGIERILVIDTDAHQGNGTMDIFYEDPRVLFISLHQDPRTLYPGRGFVDEIGRGEGEGYTVNIPMPVLADGRSYDMAIAGVVVPLINAFKPAVIIRNGGSDVLYTDMLTNLGLNLETLSGLIRRIAREAEERNLPLLDLFVSGYGSYVTEGWMAIIRGVLDEEMVLHIPEDQKNLSAEERDGIDRVMRGTLGELKRILAPYWPVFR